MLCSADRGLFLQMLNDCHRYSNAINAKGEPFPAEALLMTLVFIQHKMIRIINFSFPGKDIK
jgi:hypothetical protein